MTTDTGHSTHGLEVAVDGPIMHLTLDRPKKLNALDLDLVEALAAAQDTARQRTDIRVLILSGRGRAFCAGADLDYVQKMYRDPTRARHYLHSLRDMIRGFELLPQPVVCVVHGVVLAGGLELMMGCDIVLAASSARLGDQHSNYGFVPGGGGTQRLPRLVGQAAALDIILTGRWLEAEEARTLGLVSRVVPDEDLVERGRQLAADLARKSPQAALVSKQLVRKGLEMRLTDALDAEIEAVGDHYLAADFEIGLAAFKDRVQPEFVDRPGEVPSNRDGEAEGHSDQDL